MRREEGRRKGKVGGGEIETTYSVVVLHIKFVVRISSLLVSPLHLHIFRNQKCIREQDEKC